MANFQSVDEERLRNAGVVSSLKVFRQEYSPEKLPVGVEIVKTNVFPDETGGDFMELVRFDDGFIRSLKEKGVDLNVKSGQVNLSRLTPGTEKFGHLHPDQDELWMVGSGVLTLALYDARDGSETAGLKVKISLSTGKGVFVPHGVAHGLLNPGKVDTILVYFPTHQFSVADDTQELRLIPEDKAFWDFAKPDKV